MATNHMSEIVQQLRRAVLLQDGAGLTDGQLLGCFIEHRDEAAFATLVKRHGPMVWGVCRRLLRNHHDAEDAFQATFLVLVRKGASIVPREMVGNWLYGVAHQTALKARQTAAKRKCREKQVTKMPEPAAAEQDLWHDLQPLLDHELSRLPGKYRVAIVLCDLEGKTRKEAARQLGLPEGTVASRLTRARTMLAKRLARHGLPMLSGTLAVVLSQKAASAVVPTSAVSSTIKAASLFAAGQAAGLISVKVAALTTGVLRAMLLTQLRIVCVVLLIGGIMCAGTSVSTHFLSAQANGTEQADRTTSKTPEKDESKTNRAANPTVEQDKGQATGDSKVRALQKERLAILKEIVPEVKKEILNLQGGRDEVDLLDAKRQVLQAEFELCASDKERVEILAQLVALAKEREAIMDRRFQDGRVLRTTLLTAKAHRLEAEIALERAKSQAAGQPK